MISPLLSLVNSRGRRPCSVPGSPPGSLGSQEAEAQRWTSGPIQSCRYQNQGDGLLNKQGSGSEHPQWVHLSCSFHLLLFCVWTRGFPFFVLSRHRYVPSQQAVPNSSSVAQSQPSRKRCPWRSSGSSTSASRFQHVWCREMSSVWSGSFAVQGPEVSITAENSIPRDASGAVDYSALVQLLKDTRNIQDQADILYILFKDKWEAADSHNSLSLSGLLQEVLFMHALKMWRFISES